LGREVLQGGHGQTRLGPYGRRRGSLPKADTDLVYEAGRAGAPGVDRPPDDPDLIQVSFGKIQEGGDAGGKPLLTLAEGERQAIDHQDHVNSFLEKQGPLL
jgi:hypothetical protein